MENAPTINSLAKLAGVSNATVSLALRNHPRIRPEIRERIQKIALKAGYKTDPVVANLCAQLRSKKKSGYQSTLGLLSIWENSARLKSIHTYGEWMAGCQERATVLGYHLDHFSLVEPVTTPERLVKILHARNIRGLLIIGSDLSHTTRSDLDPIWEHGASIVMGIQPIYPRLSFVSNDQFSTTLQALNEVLRLGYRRPGLCIHPDIEIWVNKRFAGGFYVGQEKVLVKNRVPICDFDQTGQNRFTLWMKRYRPDVVITPHIECLAWLEAMDLRVPQDVGMVHLDKTPEMKCAGMLQNSMDVGRGAVDLVIGQLHRNEFGIPPFQKGVAVTSTWIPGPTIRRQIS